MANMNRGPYGKAELSERQAPIDAQIGMWWFYFKWQWLRDAHLDHQVAQNMLGVLFLLLGLAGGYVHFQKDRRSFWYFGSLISVSNFAGFLLGRSLQLVCLDHASPPSTQPNLRHLIHYYKLVDAQRVVSCCHVHPRLSPHLLRSPTLLLSLPIFTLTTRP